MQINILFIPLIVVIGFGSIPARNLSFRGSLEVNQHNFMDIYYHYSIFSNQINERLRSYKSSIIGEPLSKVTWLFKLGNYAS